MDQMVARREESASGSRWQCVDDLGKPGMPGNAPGYLTAVSAVVVAPNGDIYIADGHGTATNDRIVKYSKDGKFNGLCRARTYGAVPAGPMASPRSGSTPVEMEVAV
jgi:hypothetical protein